MVFFIVFVQVNNHRFCLANVYLEVSQSLKQEFNRDQTLWSPSPASLRSSRIFAIVRNWYTVGASYLEPSYLELSSFLVGPLSSVSKYRLMLAILNSFLGPLDWSPTLGGNLEKRRPCIAIYLLTTQLGELRRRFSYVVVTLVLSENFQDIVTSNPHYINHLLFRTFLSVTWES